MTCYSVHAVGKGQGMKGALEWNKQKGVMESQLRLQGCEGGERLFLIGEKGKKQRNKERKG